MRARRGTPRQNPVLYTFFPFFQHVFRANGFAAEADAMERGTGAAALTNELLDSMPINLRGKLVGLDGNKFVFVDGPTNAPTNQAMLDWIDCLSTKLQCGFVIAIDYGFSRIEFHEVLQVRMQHRHLDSPFEQIGDADITAHINWADLAERAEANGLRVAGFTDQHHFLTGIISDLAILPEDPKSKRALQILLHPEMLGRAFQVLALAKGADGAGRLAGFKFARDPRAVLGL